MFSKKVQIMNGDELSKWMSKYPYERFLVEPLYVGAECVIEYNNGILSDACVGHMSIKDRIGKIKNIPEKLSIQKDSIIYGDYHYDNLYVPTETIIVKGIITSKKFVFKKGKDSTDTILSLVSSNKSKTELCFKPYNLSVKGNIEFSHKYLHECHMLVDVAELFGLGYCDYWRAIGGDSAMMICVEFKHRFIKTQPYKISGCIVAKETTVDINDCNNIKILEY